MTDIREALGAIGVWGHLDSLPVTGLRNYVRHVAELGYGCLWVPETVGREPFTLLGAISEAAGPRMWLGTSIASIYARDAVTTRLAALTLHELTGGRFCLGLGVSHPHLVTRVRGHEYGRPVTTMRDYLEAYRRAPWRGPALPDGEPPVLLAALREHMTGLAATQADGAFPYLVGTERIAWMRGVLDRAGSGSGLGRPLLAVTLPVVLEADSGSARTAARAYLAPYVRTPNYQASWAEQGFAPDDWAQPGSDRLVDAMVAWGDGDTLRARIGVLLAAGADHVALIPLAPDGLSEEHLPALEALAPTRGHG